MATWFKFWASSREDAKLRSLTDFEFRYWTLLLCLNCEQGGTVDLSDREDVCIDIGLLDESGEPSVTMLDALLSKLAKRKLCFEDAGTLSFNGWERRQMKPSDRPDAIRKRVQNHRSKTGCNADVTRYVTPTEVEVEDRKIKTLRQNDANKFASFWTAYPRKVGKKDAMKAWLVAVKETPCDTIISSLRSYRFDTRDGGRFIPHPATWLRQGRYLDEPDAPKRRPCVSCGGVVQTDCPECGGTGNTLTREEWEAIHAQA